VAEKINVKLGKVQETLLLPLIARAKESRKENGIIKDSKAAELLAKIDFDVKRVAAHITDTGVVGLATRAYKMDEAIRQFLLYHPHGKVLNIGAGLDTAFYRCDNGTVEWYDLDLPDSMEIRKQLLPVPNERVHYLSKSMFDYSWTEDIGDIKKGLLIIVPGVLPYFKEEEVKDFLQSVAPRLTGAQILFDVISHLGRVVVNKKIQQVGMPEARLQWGIIDPYEIEEWSDHIKVLGAEKLFEGVRSWKQQRWTTWQAMLFNDFLSVAQIFHLKFV